ncbi:MAG: hypothetical protein HFF18_06780 [Oscillospiraceae bacterium]|nr:hypothetical protein [Oscillospiraceae bacterium]
MKHTYTWLTLALAAAVCAAAIVLPSHAVGWQDKQRWFDTVASEDISQADVSFNYALTAAERVDLTAEYMLMSVGHTDGALDVSLDQTPTENEISAEQALEACVEELRELSRLAVLPQIDWDSALEVARRIDESTGIDKTYYRLMDWEDAQRRLSLWVISVSLEPYRYVYEPNSETQISISTESVELLPDMVTCLMDAETGKVYFVSLMGGISTALTLSQVEALYDALEPEAWAEYLGLSTPELTEPEPEFETYIYDSEGAMDPVPLETPVKWNFTFPQEELDLKYYLIFEQREETIDVDLYNHKAGESLCWFQLSYSPVWPV